MAAPRLISPGADKAAHRFYALFFIALFSAAVKNI